MNKLATLFVTGGALYYTIEFIWKNFIICGNCHWSMFILGGLCFIAIGSLNEYIPWEWSLIKQGIIGAIIITSLEFVFGLIFNIWLQLDVWDYSHLPLNFMGQICLPFSITWFFLSLVGIILDDYLRYRWYGEEKPHYHLV